ncbi:MAG: hypothetical protein UHD09_04345, partial [Bifidobacterium sp.]|nr:hypothetical protein [Bifidobacterium sp.]
SAPASVQQYAGVQQVNLVPTVEADRELLGNASGTVTASFTDGELRSGSRAHQVNGRTVVALHTATPLYRDLHTKDTSEDVRALNDELDRLGYAASPGSDTFTWATGAGWRQLMRDNGNAVDDGETVTAAVADTLWVPQDTVAVTGWSATQGTVVTAGQAVGKVAGGLTKLAVRGGQASDAERTVSVFGVDSTLPAGSVEVTDAETLAKVEASDSYQAKSAEERAAGLDATVALAQPVDTLRVPAAAVFGVQGSAGCIAAERGGKLDTLVVDIVSGELGASLVVPRDGSVDDVATVALGARLNGLECPAGEA